jgi:hypothetical protein
MGSSGGDIESRKYGLTWLQLWKRLERNNKWMRKIHNAENLGLFDFLKVHLCRDIILMLDNSTAEYKGQILNLYGIDLVGYIKKVKTI